MKTRTFVVVLILVLAVLVIIDGCATSKKAISHEDVVEMFSGTWANLDNPTMGTYANLTQDATEMDWFHNQKFVLTLNKEFRLYHSVDDVMTFMSGKYTVINSWEDRKGNIYCQAMCKAYTGSKFYALWKIDESNTVLEQNFYYGGSGKYPTNIITHDVIEDDLSKTDGRLYYNIYYRQ